MPSCLIYYGTSEGQTAKIANHVAERLRQRVIEVTVIQSPEEVAVDAFDGVLVGDSIHMSRYHRDVIEFIKAQASALQARPSGFFTVCLAAASSDDDERRDAEKLVHQMIDQTGWPPDRVAAFGGAVKYSRYGLIKRLAMRQIAASKGGDTDTTHDYEYTDWHSVDAFADDFADHLLLSEETELAVGVPVPPQ